MQIFGKFFWFFLFATASLTAVPQAVIFDWGNVLAFDDRSVVVNFMCETFHFSENEFEIANLEKKEMVKAGKSDVDFWMHYAKEKGTPLPNNWPQLYQSVLKASVGVDPEMYALVNELKDLHVRVGLLSNINDRYTKLIRDFGFYDPFNPCLLSCEIGFEKPHKEAYEALLKALDLPAEEVVFIDDKSENVVAAKKNDIDAILFKSAQQIRSELLGRGLELRE